MKPTSCCTEQFVRTEAKGGELSLGNVSLGRAVGSYPSGAPKRTRPWLWLRIKPGGQAAGGPWFHLPGQPILEFRVFEPQPYGLETLGPQMSSKGLQGLRAISLFQPKRRGMPPVNCFGRGKTVTLERCATCFGSSFFFAGHISAAQA